MAKNDNPHALRFISSMEKHNLGDEAIKFSQEHPLSKSADIEKKFEWAQNVCDFLNETFDAETVKAVRMDCACGPELGKAKKIKELYEKESDPQVFVEKANKLNQGFTLEYDGEFFYLIYPQCYCSCVKRIEKGLPQAWCHCTLGYTKKMFDFIFDTDVKVELLSSIKLGNENCKIRIRI